MEVVIKAVVGNCTNGDNHHNSPSPSVQRHTRKSEGISTATERFCANRVPEGVLMRPFTRKGPRRPTGHGLALTHEGLEAVPLCLGCTAT